MPAFIKWYNHITLTASVASVVVGVVLLIQYYPDSPDMIFTCLDLTGDLSWYGSKAMTIILLCMEANLVGLMSFAQSRPDLWYFFSNMEDEVRQKCIRFAIVMIGISKIALSAILTYNIYCALMQQDAISCYTCIVLLLCIAPLVLCVFYYLYLSLRKKD